MFENLIAFRNSLGLKQSEFADSIGYKRSTYAAYEKGEREPRSDFWVAISSSRGLPDSGIELTSPALAGRFCTTEPPGRPHVFFIIYLY